MTSAPTSLLIAWANCVERLKDRINNRSFWEALEATRPITIEDNTLIIGLESVNLNRASYIQQTQAMNTVKITVAEILGKPLDVRLIEGITRDDWETAKERDAKAASIRAAEAAAPDPLVSSDGMTWEMLAEHVYRLYSQFSFRSLPQSKARYANEALYTVAEAMDGLYEDPADEQTERSLARVLERIASVSEIPATVLAFELERLRAYRSAQEQ
jgi:hypothetical protein